MEEIISTLKYIPNTINGVEKKIVYQCETNCNEYENCRKEKCRNKTTSAYLMDSKNVTNDDRDCYIASAKILSSEIKGTVEYSNLQNYVEQLNINTYTTIPSSNGTIHEFVVEIMKELFPNLNQQDIITYETLTPMKTLTSDERERYMDKQIKDNNIVIGNVNENILLVDDITTTGSTLNMIGKVLKDNNKVEVIKYAIAKTEY